MAENLETLSRYEYGALARDLMNEFVYSNERGVRRALEVYAGSYEEALNSLSVGELSSDYYRTTLKGLAEGEDLVTVKKELGEFARETFGGIKEKLKKAAYVIQGAEEGIYDFSEKEIKEAGNIIKKYGNIINTLSILGEVKLESLRPSVVERHYKTGFKGVAGEIRDSH